MNLVIVESPTKAKTISRFLGSDFVVRSSYGHVRDLPKSKLGVDVKNNFEPTYVIPEKSKKTIAELMNEAKKAGRLIIATDEDREGEAIAWHLKEVLGGREPERIVFHEITESAIREALKNPRPIDLKLVNAQQARRILDRLVGYELSPFLWRKIQYGLSAGRVQSVALRLIVEREREIETFKPEEYWQISVKLSHANSIFEAALTEIDGKEADRLAIKSESEAQKLAKDLSESTFEIGGVQIKEIKRRPLPPFTTSTLQQAAWQRLRFSAKQTMRLAQQLYEGVDLGSGPVGLITYMRTDSTNLSRESVEKARQYLNENFGSQYALPSPRFFKTKSRLAQEAHEAIRPTDPTLAPASIKNKLDRRQFKLYELVWQRFMASQMPEARIAQTLIRIVATKSNQKIYGLRASGQKLVFDGFMRIWPTKFGQVLLPELKEGDELKLEEVSPTQHFTEPPARYNDASLVKTLEEHGIGRPSTYAPTIATIESRGYVERDENRYFRPTAVGKAVNDMLVKHFPEIVDLGFTARMEEELDAIAQGKIPWVPVIKEFYQPFHSHLEIKEKEISRREATERPSNEVCDKCGRPMVIKLGRFGEFYACSGYPKCKNTKKIPQPSLGIKCPKCGEGEVVKRRTKAKKRIFYGCSRWPECDFASWKKPVIASENKEP